MTILELLDRAFPDWETPSDQTLYNLGRYAGNNIITYVREHSKGPINEDMILKGLNDHMLNQE